MGKQAVLIDLTGQNFGYLTVIKRASNNKYNQSMWYCRCKCGKEKIFSSNDLRRGKSKSCGCLRAKLVGDKHRKHSLTNSRIYRIWSAMKKRCNNSNAYYYNRYGGRSIKVCEEWEKDFMSFYRWSIANGYKDNLSIDRINNDGNYEPDNCRWTDSHTQQRNKMNNHLEMFTGKLMCLADISDLTGSTFSAVQHRAKRKTLYKLEESYIKSTSK